MEKCRVVAQERQRHRLVSRWADAAERARAETAILPQGTRILTAQETRQTGGDTYNITIDAHTVREFEDILRIVQERRRVVRMGGT